MGKLMEILLKQAKMNDGKLRVPNDFVKIKFGRYSYICGQDYVLPFSTSDKKRLIAKKESKPGEVKILPKRV